MQNEMNKAKVRKALRKILSALANVPTLDNPVWPRAVSEFVGICDSKLLLPRLRGSLLEGSEVPEYARRFREAWTAKTAFDIQVVNGFLNEIFAAPDPIKGELPVFAADFSSGKWKPRPRTLLDALAIELMRSRKMLHRCERTECNRFFVKEFSRDRYCSRPCGKEMRAQSIKKYLHDHREELNAKRRKPGSKPRRRIAARH